MTPSEKESLSRLVHSLPQERYLAVCTFCAEAFDGVKEEANFNGEEGELNFEAEVKIEEEEEEPDFEYQGGISLN